MKKHSTRKIPSKMEVYQKEDRRSIRLAIRDRQPSSREKPSSVNKGTIQIGNSAANAMDITSESEHEMLDVSIEEESSEEYTPIKRTHAGEKTKQIQKSKRTPTPGKCVNMKSANPSRKRKRNSSTSGSDLEYELENDKSDSERCYDNSSSSVGGSDRGLELVPVVEAQIQHPYREFLDESTITYGPLNTYKNRCVIGKKFPCPIEAAKAAAATSTKPPIVEQASTKTVEKQDISVRETPQTPCKENIEYSDLKKRFFKRSSSVSDPETPTDVVWESSYPELAGDDETPTSESPVGYLKKAPYFL